MRFKTKFVLLSAACLSLTVFASGCSNDSVNEPGAPPGSANAAPPKDAQPPPTSYKEYYERTQAATPPGKGAALAKPKDEPKK
jgi:hypothetical protein